MSNYLDKIASLTPHSKRILCDQATESPYSGQFNDVLTKGTYLCRRCGLALFRADSQFSSGCGWPSFDVEIPDTVKKSPDPDGVRTEITCNRCHAHLGHIFEGEQLTTNNRRYCVNAASLDYVEDSNIKDTEEAIVAGGCFWGVDYYLRALPGVLALETGYTGGHSNNPGYADICEGNTGHYEAVRVIYDPLKISYEAVLKCFFEIHDPTQFMGQGPDLGYQYQSAVFYYNEEQREIAQILIDQLKNKGYATVTQLLAAQTFWPAEASHQDYYGKNGKQPYCHSPVKRFKGS